MSATTPVLEGARPPYRPALDGLRALAVVGVVVFHLNPQWLPGGWFGVDLFFVLSGFLITTLIIREQNKTGRINFPAFWRARMRRLLPALVTTLFVVVLAAWFITIDARRSSVSYDILAALGYVANWRFVLSDEGYFAALHLPSPVRHTWSLSIEEQFYVMFPLLMTLLASVTTKRVIHGFVLVAIAVASAALMMFLYVPGTDPVRAYFGTDTRAFELLIGAIGALFLRHQAFSGFAKRTVLIHVLAWIGFALVLVGMLFLPEDSPIPYRGGLILLCLASLAMILAAASSPESVFSRVFGFAPFRWIGLISYPLYLWHWPVIVFTNTELTGLRGVYLSALQATLAVLLAWATYTFIEGPIRGRRPLFRDLPRFSRWFITATIPVLVLVTILFGRSTLMFTDANPTPGHAEVEALDVSPTKKRTAMVLGNSIPYSLAKFVQPDAHPYLTLTSNTNIGCEPLPGNKFTEGKEVFPDEACYTWRQQWPKIITETQPDVVVYFVSQTLVSDRIVDGKRLKLGTRAHDRLIEKGLAEIKRTSLKAGSRFFAISTLACHNIPTFDAEELVRINDVRKVKHINEVATKWAESNDVRVVDTYSALCPSDLYSRTINSVPLYGDGLHFTTESGPIFWDWMAPQLIAYLEEVDGAPDGAGTDAG